MSTDQTTASTSGSKAEVLTSPESAALAENTGNRRMAVSRIFSMNDGDVGRLIILALLLGVLGVVSANFFSKDNWIATSQYSTEILFLAIGQAFVIITGGIDLSVGSVLGCSAMVGAIAMERLQAANVPSSWVVVLGFAVGVLAGALMGLINGLVITKMHITPFIATLGMLGVAGGVTNLLNGGVEIVDLPPSLNTIGNTTLLGGWVTIPVVIAAIAAVVAGLVLSRTRFGLRTYAIGSNQAAAKRAGINVDNHLIKVYVFSGIMASIAGVLLMARFVDASPLAGTGDELAAIAAAVIGGASLTGGRGTILGAVIGATITATLETGLILAHVASFWQTVAIGIIIVLAVYGDQLRSRASGD